MDIQRDDVKRKRIRRRYQLGVAIAAILAVSALGMTRLESAAPSVDRGGVWIDTVKRGEMLRQVRGQGVLVPKEIRWVAAETAARVERILVKPGAVVTPETVIMELSNPEVTDQLLTARTQLSAALADLTAKRVDLESQALDQRATLASADAEFEGARMQADAEGELTKQGIISKLQSRQSELKARQLGLRVEIERERIAKFQQNIEAQLSAARARIQQMQNTLTLRQRHADAFAVKAGISGVLQQVAVEEGQQVLAGSNLARVARPDILMAELSIAETQAKDVAIGQSVKIDTRNGVVPGKVARIDPAVRNGAVLVDVDLIGSLPQGARPDLSVDATVEIERLRDVMYIGRPAFGQPDTRTTVFRLDSDGVVARRVPIQLGRSSVSSIEIVKGLREGEKVILSDVSAWEEHDRIELN